MEATWETVDVRKFKPIIIIVILLIVIAILASGSVIYIGGTQVGIVEKKFGGGDLPENRVLAPDGENGIQAKILAPGWHFFYWTFWRKVNKVDAIEVKSGSVGLVYAVDGQPFPKGTIYAPEWADSQKMLEASYFLGEGKGYKGPQLSVLTPGTYRLNTELFKVEQVPVTNVKVGTVAVIKSNIGDRVATDDRLVEKGQRGIWKEPLLEGQYRLHADAYEVTMINTRQVKVSYTAERERGESNVGQPTKPITVRSSDGFTFPVDVRITYRIDQENAPRVVAMIGDDDLVLDKLVTPRVRATFRNNAGQVKALDYVQSRNIQEQQSAEMLKEDLAKHGITVLAVSIGDVGDEKTLGLLLKTQTDREIALQEQETFTVQQAAAEKEKELKKTQQEAEEERRLATARYNVQISTQAKEQRIIEAQAEAQHIMLTAEAKAEAYKKISDVIGSGNAALLEIMKLVATNQIKITPDVMIGSGGAGATDALMGTMLRGMLKDKE